MGCFSVETMLRCILRKTNILSKCKKRFFSSDLINLGILAHIDAGKTTISEDILFQANEIKVKGNINDQNTQLDFLKQERERGITIKTAYSCFFWKNKIINLIDTPGHIDFSNELFLSLCVSDKCVIVIDAKESVQIQTINIFRYIKEHIPIYFFLNKMDIYETDLEYNLKSLKNNLSKKAVLVTFPIYIQKKLKYILDIPSMMLYSYPPVKYGHKQVSKKFSFEKILKKSPHKNYEKHFALTESCMKEEDKEENNDEEMDGNGKYTDEDINTSIEDLLKEESIFSKEMITTLLKIREELIETVCDLDSQMEYKYINNIPIKYKELKQKLCYHIKQKNMFPVFSGSALNSVGVNLLLDYVVEETEKTEKTEEIIKDNKSKEKEGVSVISKQMDTKQNVDNEKLVVFIFKLVNEKNGFNTFCKVLKGTLKKNSKLRNLRNNTYEHIKNIYKIKADRYIIAKELRTNDIGMIRGVEQVRVCDILCEEMGEPIDEQMSEHISGKENDKIYQQRNRNDISFRNGKKNEKNELKIKNANTILDNNAVINDEIQINTFLPVNQMYGYMKTVIKNKEFWYFLKNYQKRMHKSIIVCKCAVEPVDIKKEKELQNIINQICLEDNSIQAYIDKSNKLIIGSIGILNIEVVLDKIQSEYKIDLKTSKVETIRKEYIVGKYHTEIQKQMKLGSHYSNIEVGISITEKEFLDVISYVQNILKYDTVSQFRKNTNETKQNALLVENHVTDEEMDICATNVPTDETENKNPIFSKNKQSKNVQSKIMNSTALHINNEKTGKWKKKCTFTQNFHSSDQCSFKEKTEPAIITDCEKQTEEETKEESEQEQEQEDENEDIDEYLLNINYEQLFQSDVLVDPSVQMYIADLKQRNPKKKKLYDDIIKSCVTAFKNCLSNGHTTNENIINTEIKITKLKIYDDTTTAVAKYACNDLYYKTMKTLTIQMAEPIALIQIHTNESCVGLIVKDLIQNRKGSIIQIMKNKKNTSFQIMKIFAIIPVEHTHNYVSILRSISSGHADFYLTCCGYKKT